MGAEVRELRNHEIKRSESRMPMMRLPVRRGLTMFATGPRIPRTGSSRPQFSSLAWVLVVVRPAVDADALGASSASPFLRRALVLGLELMVSVRGREDTPARRALTRSAA